MQWVEAQYINRFVSLIMNDDSPLNACIDHLYNPSRRREHSRYLPLVPDIVGNENNECPDLRGVTRYEFSDFTQALMGVGFKNGNDLQSLMEEKLTPCMSDAQIALEWMSLSLDERYSSPEMVELLWSVKDTLCQDMVYQCLSRSERLYDMLRFRILSGLSSKGRSQLLRRFNVRAVRRSQPALDKLARELTAQLSKRPSDIRMLVEYFYDDHFDVFSKRGQMGLSADWNRRIPYSVLRSEFCEDIVRSQRRFIEERTVPTPPIDRSTEVLFSI